MALPLAIARVCAFAARDRSVNKYFDALPDGVKHALDFISFAALLGSLISVLPVIASVLTIVWTAIRIYETPTVQALIHRKERL